jgi:phosphoribosylaminoimidazole-succinocarboxamide synthase
MPSDSIPELIDEQDVAALLERQTHILDAARHDEAAQIHVSAVRMAKACETYLRECYGHLADTKSEAGRHGDHLLDLIDYTVQLRAHHLDYLDRLIP